ncbi:MAG: hypothetical protein AAFQ53_12500, partial [Bacteroidota bacterium]
MSNQALALLVLALLATALACTAGRPRGGPALRGDVGPTWLEETDVIDWRTPAILAAVEHAVDSATDPVDRAVRIHDFVRDRVRFGWQPRFYEV